MSELEIWRVVPSDPTLEASSLGRVRIVPYERAMPHGGTATVSGQPTFGYWDKAARRFKFARRNYPTRKVARLVCEAFHGPAPEGKPNVLHGDEDSRNNRADNLSWGTQKENLNAPGFLAYCRSRTGQSNPHVKGRRLAA